MCGSEPCVRGSVRPSFVSNQLSALPTLVLLLGRVHEITQILHKQAEVVAWSLTGAAHKFHHEYRPILLDDSKLSRPL
eukprot:scaffold660_cov57-Attheya_sp.AAC.5